MPIEPTALESPFGFEPLIIPPQLTIKQALEAGIAKVERSRAWSGHSGIRTLIGETGGSYIEETLACDGSCVVEIGAGKLRAAEELAIRYPSSRVLAVEPFVQPPLDQIIKQFHLESVLKLSRTTGTIFVIEVKKTPGVSLEFGRYRLETSLSGNFSGDVNSLYIY